MRTKPTALTAFFTASLVALAACGDPSAIATDPTTSTAGADPATTELDAAPMAWRGGSYRATLVEAVETWNDNIEQFGLLAAVSPPAEARMSAMANTTVHDVLNAVQRRFEPYAYHGSVGRPVSVEAAIATGAFDVLSTIGKGLPTTAALDFITLAYNDYMAALDACDEVTRGTQLGHDAAAAMLALRAGDGSAAPPVAIFTSTGEAGKFRSPVGSATALTGPQAISFWGTVKPFVMASGSQFRSPPMYGAATVEDAVKTPAYLADYAEVKRLGGMVSERTQEQTDIGFFWIESTVQGWNRIARVLADKRHLNAWRLARLLAHVSLSEADAYISSFDGKYFYNFWRPVTAIRLGNLDANTPGDPTWQVSSLLVPDLGGTPPIPEYASGHAIAGGAAAQAILENLEGSTAFSTTSGTLPGATRSFRSVLKAARENADSRIYIGFHFRHATDEGLAAGLSVGKYVGENSLQRVRGH